MFEIQKTLQTLEYDKIIARLLDRALTEGAKEKIKTLLPSGDYETVCERQKYTRDARRIVAKKGYPPLSQVADILDALERADKGASLSNRELLSVARVLTVSRALKDYHEENDIDDNSLREYFEGLAANRTIENAIGKAILSDDTVADEASPELADIRRKIRAANNRIKETLQKYVGGTFSRYLQENLITTRDGRYVIPVKAEYRNEIKGLIHDTSSSGATVFIEPIGVVEANNDLRLLAGKEQNEIERILASLSALVASYSGTLRMNYHAITAIAFYFSLASLAEEMHAEAPVLSKKPLIRLKKARHPLLDREKAVPINVSLGDGYQTLVITGPNTGGKTVTLKTVGLLALMVQAGMQIPASPESEVGVFSEVLADIGDEQSIEQSLSTFSSHIVHIAAMLQGVTERSLLLFDELGAGTDPVEGAALATAILEHVKSKGAITAATTHYAELKAYALETDGVQNASCEFDLATLSPTYRLIIGTPGKSNAFAIAGRLGVPADVIAEAETLVSGVNRRFEGVIEKLESSRTQMEMEREEAARLRLEYETYKRKAEAELSEKLSKAEKEAEKMTADARRTLEGARATSDFVMKQLEDAKRRQEKGKSADLSEARRKMRERMEESAAEIAQSEPRLQKADLKKIDRPLRVGDTVYLLSLGQVATVAEVADRAGNVLVKAGILSAKVRESELRFINETIETQPKKSVPKAPKTAATQKKPLREAHAELDVRGMYAPDAWEKVDRFLDEAVLSGLSDVRIIHGKGTGALRTALQEELRADLRVRSFRNGAYGEGDNGVTVVILK